MDRQKRLRAVAVTLVAVIVLTVLITRVVMERGPSAYKATITVDTMGKTTGKIDSQFIGLSFESGTLNSGEFANIGDLAQLLRNLGQGVIRFGGNSVDRSFTGMTTSALGGLVRLVNAAGWQVLYTENLGTYNAATVTADAKAVSTALGGKLFAFACGNEPDIYRNNGLRSGDYNVGDYMDQVAACFKTIRAAAPNSPLEGPDFAGSPQWLAEYAVREAGIISWLGQHYYPLGCAKRGENPATAVGTLLSPALTVQEAATFGVMSAAAKTAGVPLVITETNSACGGGLRGLSDSYASALWVIDYMLTGAEHDVYSMNFHGGLDGSCEGYTVLCQIGTNTYRAQPIYYGMLLTHLLGTGRFLPVKVTMSSRVESVVAFALKPTNGAALRLIVENLSKDQADTTLHIGNTSGSATVLTLSAPSLLATSGVQIQGTAVAANGSFSPGSPESIQCTAHSCPVTLAPYTAALVTVG
jgi:hypothetical protein